MNGIGICVFSGQCIVLTWSMILGRLCMNIVRVTMEDDNAGHFPLERRFLPAGRTSRD